MKKISILMILPPLLLTSCDTTIRKTPLEWCLWEIHKHEDHNFVWSYVYNDIQNYDDESNYNLSAYYITVFMDDRIGDWYCFVECEHKSLFDKMAGRKDYSWEEVNMIDCDLAKETIL